MRRFVLAVKDQLPDEATSISRALTGLGVEWWAWIPGFWLLASEKSADELPTVALRDAVRACFVSPKSMFIAEVEPKKFGGQSTEFQKERILAWLNKWWRDPELKPAAFGAPDSPGVPEPLKPQHEPADPKLDSGA